VSLLDDGVSAEALSQLRCFGCFVVVGLALAIAKRPALRVERKDIPRLALLGVAGFALVQGAYFVAIDHLGVGQAVTIQYMAPLLLLVWMRVVIGTSVAPGLWGAVALSVTGCFLVVRAWDTGEVSGIGVVAALVSLVSFAFYLELSERLGKTYGAETILVWGMGFATLAWFLASPVWNFPFDVFDNAKNAGLGIAMVLGGTVLPFLFMLAALRMVPAARAAIVATLEPVLGAVFAWVIHDQSLAAVQVAGGVVVLAAVAWVQSQRQDIAEEAAPALREAR
jgi:drug/metabolite transporter (DMT)-like permease